MDINLDGFETRVVFRTARGYFAALAVFGLLAFVVGGLFGASGVLRTTPPEPMAPELPAPIPEPEPVELAAVKAFVERPDPAPESEVHYEEVDEGFDLPEPSEEDAVLSAEQEKLLLRQNLIAELEALFPKPEYTWKTTYKVVCVRNSPYGCLRTERQRDQDGIIEVIDANITPEMVESLDDSLVTFGTLVRVLKEAPLMERGKLIEPTLKILRERRAKFLEQTRIRDLEIRVIQYEHNEKLQAWQTQVDTIEKEKEEALWTGMYAIAAGLVLLSFVGVFLAHLAIERHLRGLKDLMRPAA